MSDQSVVFLDISDVLKGWDCLHRPPAPRGHSGIAFEYLSYGAGSGRSD